MNPIIRTSVLTLIALIGVSLPTGRTGAAESAEPALTGINYVDLYYDFDFYAGQPRFAWVIIWEANDGTLYESGAYETEQEASLDASLAFGSHRVPISGAHQRVSIVDYEIVYKEIEPIMEYIATYDTLAAAESAANYFEMYGYYTEIDFVSLYTYEAP